MKVPVFSLILLGSLGACSTVQTARVDGFHPHADSVGFTYFLPTRPVRFTATRSLASDATLTALKSQRESTLRGATEAFSAADKSYNDAQALLEAAQNAGAEEATLAALRVARDTAAAQRITKESAKEEAQSQVDQVNAQIAGTVTSRGCQYSAKLELLAPQADTNYRMVANMDHSGFRDDLQTFTVSNAGLLTSANVTATDRTGDVLVEAANLAGRLSTLNPALLAPGQEGGVGCADGPGSFVLIFDPLERVSYDGTNLKFPEVDNLNFDLRESGFPLRLQIEADFLLRSIVYEDDAGVEVEEDRYIFDHWFGSTTSGSALFYRTPVPVTLNIWTEQVRGSPIASTVVSLPQAGPISSIPIRSAAFVKSQDTLVFQDGTLTSWTRDRPSEFAAGIALPGRIIGGFVGGVVQGVADNVAIGNAETDNIENELAVQRARLMRDAITVCLNQAAQTEGANPLACFPEMMASDDTADDSEN